MKYKSCAYFTRDRTLFPPNLIIGFCAYRKLPWYPSFPKDSPMASVSSVKPPPSFINAPTTTLPPKNAVSAGTARTLPSIGLSGDPSCPKKTWRCRSSRTFPQRICPPSARRFPEACPLQPAGGVFESGRDGMPASGLKHAGLMHLMSAPFGLDGGLGFWYILHNGEGKRERHAYQSRRSEKCLTVLWYKNSIR